MRPDFVAGDPMIDWTAVQREALDIFVRYLQIDTTNPPGNEKPAARFLGSLIEAEGIETEYIETLPLADSRHRCRTAGNRASALKGRPTPWKTHGPSVGGRAQIHGQLIPVRTCNRFRLVFPSPRRAPTPWSRYTQGESRRPGGTVISKFGTMYVTAY